MPLRIVQRFKDYVFIWKIPGSEEEYCLPIPDTDVTGIFYDEAGSTFRVTTRFNKDLVGVYRFEEFKVGTLYTGVHQITTREDLEQRLITLRPFLGTKFMIFVENLAGTYGRDQNELTFPFIRDEIARRILDFFYDNGVFIGRIQHHYSELIVTYDVNRDHKINIAFMPSINMVDLTLSGINPNGYILERGAERWLCRR